MLARPMNRCVAILACAAALACSDPAPRSSPEPRREPEPQPRSDGRLDEHAHGEPTLPAPVPPPPDEVSGASPHAPHHAESTPTAGPVTDELGVAAIVRRNHERMETLRDAPVHVLAERDPLAAGRRICEAVVPQRPPETPVLLKPNLSGMDGMRQGIDNGVELRTTGIEFLRGVIRCLRARGHREITITEAWSRPEQRERWMLETGLDRLIEEEDVRFVGLWEDRGPDGTLSPMIAAPFPRARHLRSELLVPRLLARHMESGLYISIPRMKMHRYAVMSLGIKNTMGMVVLQGAEEPGSRSGSMHAEIGAWLNGWRNGRVDDRDTYVRSLELFAERLTDVLEIELPDAVLIDGVPPVAGDGFQLTEPFDDGVAIGSTNPVLADAVGMEWMGYLDNADLEREIRHRTSPLLEEAARRFYGSTEILRNARVVGDDSFRTRRRVGHYRAFPAFEIGERPRPAPELPWIARAITARRMEAEPVLDGSLEEWEAAEPVRIDTDYRGRSAGPETIARFAWTPDALFAAFDCAYEGELDLAEGAESGEVPALAQQGEPGEVRARSASRGAEPPSEIALYEHEVVELFIDPSPRSREQYREIEIDPLGRFLDLDVSLTRRPRGDAEWSSGMTTAAAIDREARRYRIEVRIPAAGFDAEALRAGEWRINVYRIAGRSPERTFLARYPTYTERPSFHVPDRFGWLRLVGR
jgi:uncharacterized protein (DUF362 family)